MKHDSKKTVARNSVAYAMIVNRTGGRQVFRAKQDRRAKDGRNHWSKDQDR